MCIQYTCRSCRLDKVIYCKSADWDQVDPKCYLPTIDPQPHIKSKRCPTCQTIEGAIRELRHLVFQKPWLETDGVGGTEKLPDWQCGETKVQNISAPDWMRVEDIRLLGRLKAMGLEQLDGREALNDGHGVRYDADAIEKRPDGKKQQIDGGEQDTQWDSDEGTLAPKFVDQNTLWMQKKDFADADVEL